MGQDNIINVRAGRYISQDMFCTFMCEHECLYSTPVLSRINAGVVCTILVSDVAKAQ